MEQIQINLKQLAALLVAKKTNSFINIEYHVDESLSRTKDGKKVLQKVVNTNLTINSDYENKVNKVLETKQGEERDFEAQAMNGKTLCFPGCKNLVANAKGEVMLYGMVENHTKPKVTYFKDNKEISFQEAKDLDLFTPSFFTRNENTSGQGKVNEENDFKPISPKIKNLLCLNIDGQSYIITKPRVNE